MELTNSIQGMGAMITYYPKLKGIAGTTNSAIFLCRLILWDGFQKGGKGNWIYKSTKDMEIETGLTRFEQITCRKKLKELGYIEEAKKGIPMTLHYRVISEKVNKDWSLFLEKEEVEKREIEEEKEDIVNQYDNTIVNVSDQQTEVRSYSKLKCGVTANCSEELPQTNTKRLHLDLKETSFLKTDSDESEKGKKVGSRNKDLPTDFKKSKLKIEKGVLTKKSKDDTISPPSSLMDLVGKGKADEKKKEISELHLDKYLNLVRTTKNPATLKTNIRKAFTAMCSIEGYSIGGRAGASLGGLPHATVNSALTFSKEEGREALLALLSYSVSNWPKVKSKVNAQTKDEKYKAGDSPSLAVIMNRYPLILEMKDSKDTVKHIAKTGDISELMGKRKEKKVEAEYIPDDYKDLVRK